MVSRRKLLLGSALGSTALLAAPGAMAFSTEDISEQSGLGIAISNRCSENSQHAEIVADLKSQLATQGARAGETLTVVCPVCGCPVSATAT